MAKGDKRVEGCGDVEQGLIKRKGRDNAKEI
jgi:hypothetical protein